MTPLATNAQSEQTGHYAAVNGLKMYYEIHGSGKPLVLIHGGGSTIESTFGRVLHELAKTHQVIATETQAHGHTPDIDRPTSFEQDADDVAALLAELKIEKADIMGFSNGGMDALQIAIRHPRVVDKLVLASTPYQRAGMQVGFWEGLQQATLSNMPPPLKEAYLKANPDEKGLQAMFDRDRTRMLAFKDFSDSDIRAIQAPTLVIDGDADVVRPEHALELSRTLPNAKLAILPGGHGEYLGEVCSPNKDSKIPLLATVMIEEFLGSPHPLTAEKIKTQDETTIRELIGGFVKAIRARDINGVMSVFAPEVVSFDFGPPLQHGGGKEFIKRWRELFESYQGAIDYEVRDLSITAGDDMAFSHSLNRISGTTRNGQKTERWLRWTAGFRKTNGKWLVVHEQVSVPVDVRTGKAMLDLKP